MLKSQVGDSKRLSVMGSFVLKNWNILSLFNVLMNKETYEKYVNSVFTSWTFPYILKYIFNNDLVCECKCKEGLSMWSCKNFQVSTEGFVSSIKYNVLPHLKYTSILCFKMLLLLFIFLPRKTQVSLMFKTEVFRGLKNKSILCKVLYAKNAYFNYISLNE